MGLVGQLRRSSVGTTLEYGALRAYARVPQQISGERALPGALVFGHQKTGTSVVASVIAQQAQVDCSIDLPAERLRPSDPSRVEVDELIRRSAPFSYRPLVKEPHWSLFAPRLLEALPDARAIGVLRDPVKTIESICFRLRIPTESMSTIPLVGPWWQPMLDGHGVASPSRSALENLAVRISLCEQSIAEASRKFPNRIRVVSYESFVESPAQAARNLVEFLGWEATGRADTDRQYQPGLRAASIEEKARYQLNDSQRDLVHRIVNGGTSSAPNGEVR